MTDKRHTTDCLEIGEFIFDMINDILPTFPIIAEQSTQLPFAIYKRVGYQGRDTKDKYNYEEQITVEVIACANKYKESLKLASEIKNRLEYSKGTWRNTFVTNVSLANTSEDYINEVYTQRMTFDISIDNHKFNEIMKLSENNKDYPIAY